MYAKGKYALLLLAMMVISPLSCFLVCLRFYKSGVSQFFMIVFAYYFGSHIALGWDLTTHYNDMREFYFNRAISDILQDSRIFLLGGDYFHVVLKIVMSRFRANPAVFAGSMAAIYATVFIHFFVQFRQFFKQYMPVLCGLLLLCVVFVVPYYWYYGVRYYPGFFFFAGFFMKYVNTGKIHNLLISFLCVFFHFALIILPIAVLLNWILKKLGFATRIALLIISFFYRAASVDFVPLLLKYFPNLPFLKMSVTNSMIRKNVIENMAEFRATGNVFYLYRDYLLLFFAILITVVFWYRKVNFRSKYTVLFGLFMTLFTMANFGYADMTFSDRTLKISLVFYYGFLFITAMNNYELLRQRKIFLLILVLIPLSYAIVSTVVEQRNYLFHIELILGNFFTQWHGGMTNRLGGFYHKYM